MIVSDHPCDSGCLNLSRRDAWYLFGPTEAGPTRAPTDTPTVELPTEPAGGSSMVTVLSPGPGREFAPQDTITFDWYWPTLPEPGQHFAVYLIDGESEYQLGALTEPNNGISYRLVVPGDEIPATGEELNWQVRLESVDGGDVQVASDLVPIVILAAAPTAPPPPPPPSSTDIHPGRLLASNCFQCHGTDGINGTFEGIAGESATELYNELKELQTTTEADEAIMKVHANGYTDEQLRLIADYFSKVPTSVRK